MKIKICGITRLDDALAAVEEGADALGFIFAQRSPRRIDPDAAAAIIRHLPPFVTPVGVFVDASREEINNVIGETGIQCLQLHGKEKPADIENYPVPVIKSFRVGPGFEVSQLSQFRSSASLLDTFVEGMDGGTGKTFNWSVALKAKSFGRIILSGGLTAENVEVAIRTVRPYAVDVNSGVESEPGKKDRDKLARLFSVARNVELGNT